MFNAFRAFSCKVFNAYEFHKRAMDVYVDVLFLQTIILSFVTWILLRDVYMDAFQRCRRGAYECSYKKIYPKCLLIVIFLLPNHSQENLVQRASKVVWDFVPLEIFQQNLV